ncbi:MAG: ABC transporter permease [Desulfurococcaceae archaeon]|jgi:ABC-type antimicrobial peptide transport system permease subunit|nr:ABC transporter permease [Desulfurococcaceae archaeon]
MVDVLWLLNTALKDLFSRKTRSILTIASIAIGIALLFSLISLVNGVKSRSATMIRQLTSADIIIRNTTRVDTSTVIPSPEETRGFIRPIALSLIHS